MYDCKQYEEKTQDILNNAESMLDGNFAVVDARWILELFLIDEEIPLLSISDTGFSETYSPELCAEHVEPRRETARYFTGDINTDAVVELYYSLIRHRNVAEFLEMFPK